MDPTDISKRRFVKAIGVATLATTIKPSIVVARQRQYDFLIIGAGTAGLPAAIFAARRGASVLLVDSAQDIGGTLHLAYGMVSGAGTLAQAKRGIVDTPDQHFDDIMRLSNGKADPSITRLVADNAGDTLNWLLDAGLTPLAEHPITGLSGRPGYSVARYFWDKDRGRAILAILRRQLAPLVATGHVKLQLGTRISELITDAAGVVTGARARVGGNDLVVSAKRTLLATGGYAMNPTLFERLVGRPAYAGKSYPFSQGDGLNMAVATGGTLRGRALHRPGTGSILTSDQFEGEVYARFNTRPEQRQPWEIWVNDTGQRFVREDAPEIHDREQALASQPRLRFRIIFDHNILSAAPPGIPDWTREKLLSHFGTHSMFVTADSLASLAAKIGVDGTALKRTVDDYNAAVVGGRDSLGRKHLPQPISTAPYYAITILGNSATSSAGVVTDNRLRVLRGDGSPIENLYAAGEVLGSGATMGDAFVPGMMLTPAFTLGRLLGGQLISFG
ncbi:MAG TPA: FAD-dependent oxidoreductase [Woeseiaceae bacterium]|nr:FAD-dependent oxidoreductase [Woeseiaceae bacterium]